MQFPAYSPQYAFGPSVAPMPMYKGGGGVKETYGLRNAAEQLRERGRGDDTILAHINPQEAGILKLLGGSGTINPYTGLPEYGWFKDTFGISTPTFIKDIGDDIKKGLDTGIESIAKALGPVGSIAAAYFGGPIGAAIYQGFAAPGDDFDFKSAAKAAALTYGAGQLQGLGGAEAGAGAGAGADLATQQAIDAGIDIVSAPSMYPSVSEAISMSGQGGIPYSADPNSYLGGADAAGTYANAGTTATDAATRSYPTLSPEGVDPTSIQSPVDYGGEPGAGPYTVSGQTSPDTRNVFQKTYADVKQGISSLTEPITQPITDITDKIFPEGYRDVLSTAKDIALIGSGATTAYGMYQTKKELDAAREEAERILADIENKKQEEIEWARGVMRDYAPNYERLTAEEVARENSMASGGIASFDDERGSDDELMQGGIASLAKGGLPPRYLQGAGDGMSDSIHARIGGKQEARLADGEFVVPADVVSHLGNGSSNAGAKKLYAMMDRVRNARTGKKRQAPQLKTERYMPA